MRFLRCRLDEIGAGRRRLAAFIAARKPVSAAIPLILVGALFCSGCTLLPHPYGFITPVVAQAGDEIVFDIPADRRPAQTQFREVLVTRFGDATASPKRTAAGAFWAMQMNIYQFKVEPVVDWPIRYGRPIANTVTTVPARKLVPGRYRFSGSVEFVGPDIERFGGYKILIVEFSIGTDQRLALD